MKIVPKSKCALAGLLRIAQTLSAHLPQQYVNLSCEMKRLLYTFLTLLVPLTNAAAPAARELAVACGGPFWTAHRHLAVVLRGGGAPQSSSRSPSSPVTDGIIQMMDRLGHFLASPHPEKIAQQVVKGAQAAGNFLQHQAAEAQDRREWYQENDLHWFNCGVNSIWFPPRLVESFVAAFAFAEVSEALWAGEGTSASPVRQVKEWWKKGRRPKDGLFRASTWSRKNREKNPAVIVAAWDRQFSRKHQKALGVLVGLILSPVLWSLTGLAGKLLAASLVVAEINHVLGEQVELLLQPFSEPVSQMWGRIDVLCERVRNTLRAFLKKPVSVSKTLWKGLDERLPDEAFPVVMQQGLLIGIVLGFVAGI